MDQPEATRLNKAVTAAYIDILFQRAHMREREGKLIYKKRSVSCTIIQKSPSELLLSSLT